MGIGFPGSIERAGPLSSEFRYITVSDLRKEGISEERLPDDRARMLIALCSNWVNWLTRQWFVPVRLRQKVSGRGSPMAHLPTFVPILELFSLELGKEGLFNFTYPDIAYQVRDRFVQLLSYQGRFPHQPEFVILDGVFGWLEDNFSPVRTTVTQAVNRGDTTIYLEETENIEVGESVLVGEEPEPLSGNVIVICKDDNAKTIDVEPVRFSCNEGESAVKYGRVPRLIQWATMLLVKDKMVPLGIKGTDADEEGPRWWADRLNSESVEGYSYGLTGLPAAYGHGGGAFTTGNPEVDDILVQFAHNSKMIYIGSVSG